MHNCSRKKKKKIVIKARKKYKFKNINHFQNAFLTVKFRALFNMQDKHPKKIYNDKISGWHQCSSHLNLRFVKTINTRMDIQRNLTKSFLHAAKAIHGMRISGRKM